MKDLELRAAYWFVAVACIGCGSSDANDFFSTARGGTSLGGGGAQPGGSGGAEFGGAGAMQPGGSGGAQPGGSGGAGQGGTSSAGAGSGGTNAGAGGAIGGGGSANGGTGAIGTGSFSCGTLMCFEGQQYCVRTLPAMSGGGEQRMCLPFPDSCTTLDCACFCKAPQMLPCGPASACMCSGDPGRVTVVCGGS